MNIFKVAVCLVALAGATAGVALMASAADGQKQTVTKEKSPRAVVIAGSGGRLGISVREVEDADLKGAGLSAPAGAVVDEVSEQSAAEKAGMRKGDVIVEFDGERVRSARQLTRLVQETPAGRKVTAVVVRDGQRVPLSAELQSGGFYDSWRGLEEWGRNFSMNLPVRPAVPPPPPAPTPPPAWRMDEFFFRGNGRLGITVDDLSPQLAEYFGTKEGVLVTSVRDASAGAKAGLKAGDVITSVNGSAIDDPAELRRRLQNIDEGEEFTVTVMRDKKLLTLKGKLESSARRGSYRSIV